MVVREGLFVHYAFDGDREERTYKNDVREGPFVYYFSEGDRFKGTYKNGGKRRTIYLLLF